MVRVRLGPPWQVPAGRLSWGSSFLGKMRNEEERREKRKRRRRRGFCMKGKEAGGASRGGGEVRRSGCMFC